jgi:hypothetical protein
MPTGCLRELSVANHYSTNRNDLVAEFYAPCTMRSVRYDRAVGYFRSSIMLLVRQAIAKFAQDGGTIRLVCSPDLTEEDIRAFEHGYEWRKQVDGEHYPILTARGSGPTTVVG